MPSSGIFELAAITGGTGALRSDDVLPIVDVHDATQAAQGSLVKITLAQLYRTETTAVTVSTPLPDIAQKWNAGGVTFTAVKLNVTDTASAAASLLLDLQVGGVSKWSVTKAGAVTQASSLTATTGTFSAASAGAVTASGGSIISTASAIVSRGTTDTGHVASQFVMDYSSGSRLLCYGPNAATNGILTIASRRSDGTNAINLLVSDTAGGIAFSGAVSGITTLAIGGALSGVTTLAMSSTLTMSAAASKIVPGATSFALRNNADSANNLIVNNAGYTTINAASSTTPLLTLSANAVAFPTTAVNSASATLGVVGDSVTARAVLVAGESASNRSAFFTGHVCGGSVSSPTATPSGTTIAAFDGRGYDTGWVSTSAAAMSMQATELWSASAHGTSIAFTVTPNGSTSAATALTIGQDKAATFIGTIIAPTGTTAIPSLRIPHGAAPTSPTNGDIWTTTAGLFVRINGATVGPLT